jgi:hypothetical protein
VPARLIPAIGCNLLVIPLIAAQIISIMGHISYNREIQ